jgi:preprotein translocase subunit SecE
MAAKTNPFTFMQQVRTEVSKVTWPTRRETITSAIMVFIMVILAGLFFYILDKGLSFVVTSLLSLG